MSALAPVAKLVIKTIPGGDTLTELVDVIDKIFADQKTTEERWNQVKESLPVWSAQFAKIKNTDAGEQAKTIQVAVENLRTFMEKHGNPPSKRDLIRRPCWATRVRREFAELFGALEGEHKNMMFLIANLTFQKVNETYTLMDKRTKEIKDQLNGHSEQMTSLPARIAERIRDVIGANGPVKIQKEKWRNALRDFQNGNDKKKREAKQNLLEWLENGDALDSELALEVSMVFIRKGDDETKEVGLYILEKLTEDPEMRKTILETTSKLADLLDLVQDQPSDAVKKGVSTCLVNLTEEDSTFFEQLNKLEGYHQAIMNANLIRQIVKAAKLSVTNEKGGIVKQPIHAHAFLLLLKLAEINDCKSAIAEARGISVLVEIYEKSAKMTHERVDDTPLYAIKALAALSLFMKGDDMWPLVHFFRKCSSLRASIPEIPYQIEDPDSTELFSATYTKKTVFGDSQERVIPIERATGEALWKLAMNDGYKQDILNLGILYKLDDTPRAPISLALMSDKIKGIDCKSWTRYDLFHGWMEMADIICRQHSTNMYEDRNDKWAFKYEMGNSANMFLEIVWNLLFYQETMFVAAEWSYANAHTYGDQNSLFKSPLVCLFGNSEYIAIREKPNKGWKRVELLSQTDAKLIQSILHNVQLEDTCKTLDVCLQKVMDLSINGEGDQKVKALSVLWLCTGFEIINPENADNLVEICQKLTSLEQVDDHVTEVFWSACLLLNMLTWTPSSVERLRSRIIDLIVRLVYLLLTCSGSSKYVFLAKHVLRTLNSSDVKASFIPFLVESYQQINIKWKPKDGNSYFQSKHYRHETSNSSDSEDEILGSDGVNADNSAEQNLDLLDALRPEHKQLILNHKGGALVVQAMQERSRSTKKFQRSFEN